MFNIPKQYIVENAIEPKTFITRDMKKPVKEKISQNLLSARLIWQIIGEEIPSLINNDYNCSAITGFDIKLKDIKDSVFFAEMIQQMVKSPCVIRFYDDNEEVYSFAHKRLSRIDATQIVIVDRVETPPLSLSFPDKITIKLRKYLAFNALLNKNDKLNLYLEASVKAFIISNQNLYSGMASLLDSKVWYNRDEILALFGRLKELDLLNAELKAEKLPGNQARLNGEIKNLMEELK